MPKQPSFFLYGLLLAVLALFLYLHFASPVLFGMKTPI